MSYALSNTPVGVRTMQRHRWLKARLGRNEVSHTTANRAIQCGSLRTDVGRNPSQARKESIMPRSKMWVVAAALVGILTPPLMLFVWAEDNAVVKDGAVVLMEFTITVPESQLVIPKNVSQFSPGHNEVLPNLEKAITGMKKGQEKRVDLSSEDAFGPYDESKKGIISSERLPPGT